MKHCDSCKHEMTDCGKDSAAEKVGACIWCIPGFADPKFRREHTQADHDDEAVCGGFMEQKTWERRNKGRKFNEVFSTKE